MHASHLHADNGYTQVRASQVHSEGALGLQNVVNILRNAILYCWEAEGLLQWLFQIDGLQKLEDARNCISITVDLGAEREINRA